MEAQCGSFMATAAQTMTLNGTRNCLAHHKLPPAVVFLCLFLLPLYLQPHVGIMFLQSRLRAFSSPYIAVRVKNYVFVYFSKSQWKTHLFPNVFLKYLRCEDKTIIWGSRFGFCANHKFSPVFCHNQIFLFSLF